MATQKQEPANDAAPAVSQQAPTPVVTEARRTGLGGLAVAGIAVGAVVVAGALFGGGVVVGTQLPPQFSASQPGQLGAGPESGQDHRGDDGPGMQNQRPPMHEGGQQPKG